MTYRSADAGHAPRAQMHISEDQMNDFFHDCEGLYVGQLSLHEQMLFDELCACDLAHRIYRGLGGFLGFAVVARGPSLA